MEGQERNGKEGKGGKGRRQSIDKRGNKRRNEGK